MLASALFNFGGCCGAAPAAVADFFRFAGNRDTLPGDLATVADAGFMLNLDLTGGSGTQALPAAAGVLPGTIVAVRKTDATNNAGTVIGQGGDTVSGPIILSQQYECLVFERRGAAEWVSWANDDGYIHPNITTGSVRVATGGNARGAEARDFQQSRAANTQVASGARAAILNGQNNTAAGADSTSCGRNNDVQAPESGNFSGNGNEVSGLGYNANVAGQSNDVGKVIGATARAVNVGGNSNTVDDIDAANVGGTTNVVSGSQAGNFAGHDNSAQALDAANVGGTNNDVLGAQGFNGGGSNNVIAAAADEAANIGGDSNNVSGDDAANVAGLDNAVAGLRAVNVGGESNAPSGPDSANVGGRANLPSANKSANLGGEDNDIQGENAVNVGGTDKTLGPLADSSVALGGVIGTINGARSILLGGQSNQLDGDDAAVMGSGNYVAGPGTWATGKDAAADRPCEVAQGAGGGTQGAAQSGTLIYAAKIPAGGVTELDLANVAGEYSELLDGDNYAVQVREANAKVPGTFSAASWFSNAANSGMIWRDAGVTAGIFSGPQAGLYNDALNFAPQLELFADVANNRLAVYVDNTLGPDAYCIVTLTYTKRNS